VCVRIVDQGKKNKMTETTDTASCHSSESQFRRERIDHWDRVSHAKENARHLGRFYQQLLQHYYGFFVPKGLRVLELGCGHGDLLASLQPSLGVGIDFSKKMLGHASEKHPHLSFICADVHDITFKDPFDVVILSDLVNDLWDVQTALRHVRENCHPGTRVFLNFFNNLWRLPFSLARWFKVGADVLEQNWFSPHDIANLLSLTDFEVIKRITAVLMPVKIPVLSTSANRYLAKLAPFAWFALTNIFVARPAAKRVQTEATRMPTVSVIIPARNEAGNIENIFRSVPELGSQTELVFVEGHSSDKTYETIEQLTKEYAHRSCSLFRQSGEGKGDAVRLGFEKATGDILMILDADLTVPPEDLPRFYEAMISGKGEFVNGVRLVYPLENESMRFFNILGNKLFSLAFSWLLGQPIKDTLCGTKVLWKSDYEKISENREYFGNFDPFGDFDLLFGAAKLTLKIVEMPVRYRSRIYGETNISRWRHGWLLFKMVLFAAKRIKFI
jgi:ubiquinone/menaquinone biosynthesis C-methylase UbiE